MMRYHGGEMAMAAFAMETSPFLAFVHPEKYRAERRARELTLKAMGFPACREGRPRPVRENVMDAFADALKISYGARLWWSCNGYMKQEDIYGRVWIAPPSREIEVGSGNKARRRLGQTWAMEPDPDACSCRATDCECSEQCCPSEKGVWRNADGTVAGSW